jgi:hypothetical protein
MNPAQLLTTLRQLTDTASKYRDQARARYHVKGELEIGQSAEVHRTNKGAWIRAYVFIPKSEVTK